MSKTKNLEIVLKITFLFYNCDEYALNYFKKCLKNGYIFYKKKKLNLFIGTNFLSKISKLYLL